MRKAAAIFLVFIFFVCGPYGLYAREMRGNQIDINFKNGERMMGELIGVKSDHLMVLEFYSPNGTRVDIDDVMFIDITKQSRVGVGILFGGVIGLATGVVIGGAVSSTNDNDSFGDAFEGLSYGLLAVALSTVAGVAIGGTIGRAAGGDERIFFEGKSEAEIQRDLNKLRRFARIPNYQ